MVKVGQKVTRLPKTVETQDPENRSVLARKPIRGIVVYVHPKGRFHVVEFENLKGDKLRETFDGVD